MNASIAAKLSTLLCAAALLCACGGGKQPADASQAGATDAALPEPDAGAGSVTGMSGRPGPGDVPLAGAPPPQADDPADLFNPETGFLPGSGTALAEGAPATTAAEPTVQDAVAVIREYYASIDSGSFARAYALWADGGRASGQTPAQFSDGFAAVASLQVEIGMPGDVDAGAGQRHVQVPVTVTAIRHDGERRRSVGSYTLQRSVVDGASAEQRAWRIASADLRALVP